MPTLPTWRNIAAPSNQSAIDLLKYGNEQVAAAGESFTDVGQIFVDRATRDDARLKDQFAASIDNISSLEELAQAEQRLFNSGVRNPGQFTDALRNQKRLIENNDLIRANVGGGQEGFERAMQGVAGQPPQDQQSFMEQFSQMQALQHAKSAEKESEQAITYGTFERGLQGKEAVAQAELAKFADKVSYDALRTTDRADIVANMATKLQGKYEQDLFRIGEISGSKLNELIHDLSKIPGVNERIIDAAISMSTVEDTPFWANAAAYEQSIKDTVTAMANANKGEQDLINSQYEAANAELSALQSENKLLLDRLKHSLKFTPGN